ncbi:MAG TPA: tetratricopeptide repeat protein, partial [Noviherbaspirillum sp.]|nr:tetratricopeptide repeat protein [Noviherbaspirillum sp.]
AAYTVETAGIQIRRSTDTRQILSATSQAYQAFLAGEYQAAEQLYRRSLQQEPHSRDALLGLATLALKREQPEQAAGYFSRLLDADPADPDAIAGLLSLQQGDVAQDESRLKKALAQHPQSGALHFALGNLYAQQSRWGDAQQAYFRAFANAPGNADYAFNLGVSLDRLSQPKLALDYYRKALQFAANGTKGFQEAAVRDRIRALQEVVAQ